MDYTQSFDNYIKYDKSEAYDLYCDEKNLIRFKRILLFLSIIVSIGFIASIVSVIIDSGNFFKWFRVVFYALLLAGILFLFIRYNLIFNTANIRKRIFVFVISFIIILTFYSTISLISNERFNLENSNVKKSENQILQEQSIDTALKKDKQNYKTGLTINTSEEGDTNKLEYTLYFCLIIIFLCLSKSEYIQLYSLSFAFPFISQLLISPSFIFKEGLVTTIVVFSLTLLSLIISNTLSTKRQNKFNQQYNYYYKKNYDTIRMKKELDYARQIQLSMLPEPKKVIDGIKISAISIPAMEVGGDYFDYFELPGKKLGVFICDVSGHGVASALLLSGIRSSIHLILEDTHNPKEIFKKLNLMIRRTQQRKMFVSAIFAVVDPLNNSLLFYNAGHLPPYKIDNKNQELFLFKKHNVTLGLFNDIPYEKENDEVIIDFNVGDKFILYTDGLNEAINKSREDYGFERIENILNSNINSPSEELLNKIIDDVNKFMSETEQIDDLTIVIIERCS
ncbi:MAG: PP2C family protein-serine/threonine phosphatase [Ignavibacteria bacterium]|nr:PP2C family protein-serine/threonine phosphatase [Ignavibacteria bacterium]